MFGRLDIKKSRWKDRGFLRDFAGCLLRGKFKTRILGPDGKPVRDWIETPNAATYEGMNYSLDASFRGQTQLSSWYILLISGSGFSAVSISDTAASHAGWTENSGYSEGTRRQWSPSAAALGVLVNSAVTFTSSGPSTVQGFGLISDSTKGGSSGKLFSTATLSSPDSLTASQTYQAIYEVDYTPVS